MMIFTWQFIQTLNSKLTLRQTFFGSSIFRSFMWLWLRIIIFMFSIKMILTLMCFKKGEKETSLRPCLCTMLLEGYNENSSQERKRNKDSPVFQIWKTLGDVCCSSFFLKEEARAFQPALCPSDEGVLLSYFLSFLATEDIYFLWE